MNSKHEKAEFDVLTDLSKGFPKIPESFEKRMQETLDGLSVRHREVKKARPRRIVFAVGGVAAAAALAVVLVLFAPRLLGSMSMSGSPGMQMAEESAAESMAPAAEAAVPAEEEPAAMEPEPAAEAPAAEPAAEEPAAEEPAEPAPAAEAPADAVMPGSADGEWSDGPSSPAEEAAGQAEPASDNVADVEGAEQAAQNAVELQYLCYSALQNGNVPDVSHLIERNSSTEPFFEALEQNAAEKSGATAVRGDYAVQSVQRRNERIYMDITVRTTVDDVWISDNLTLSFTDTPGGPIIVEYTNNDSVNMDMPS